MSDNNRLNFGVLLPTRECVMAGRAEPSSIFELADRAEALGFHSVWVGDSLTARPRVEALTTLAAVGARTRHVRLGTAIFLAALRHPILLAYQLTRLDWLTRGRVDLGIGGLRLGGEERRGGHGLGRLRQVLVSRGAHRDVGVRARMARGGWKVRVPHVDSRAGDPEAATPMEG